MFQEHVLQHLIMRYRDLNICLDYPLTLDFNICCLRTPQFTGLHCSSVNVIRCGRTHSSPGARALRQPIASSTCLETNMLDRFTGNQGVLRGPAAPWCALSSSSLLKCLSRRPSLRRTGRKSSAAEQAAPGSPLKFSTWTNARLKAWARCQVWRTHADRAARRAQSATQVVPEEPLWTRVL